jgi:hypothetical protein
LWCPECLRVIRLSQITTEMMSDICANMGSVRPGWEGATKPPLIEPELVKVVAVDLRHIMAIKPSREHVKCAR